MRRCLLVPYQGRLELPPYFLNLRGTRKNAVQHLQGTRIDSTFTRTQDGAKETTTPLDPADPRYIVGPLPDYEGDLCQQVKGVDLCATCEPCTRIWTYPRAEMRPKIRVLLRSILQA
jgi:hypothetical protein